MLVEVTRIEKIDDYTVRMEMDEPSPLIPVKMTSWIGGSWVSFQPKHYLEKWHIKYNPKADELAKKEGFENWWEAFYYHYWWVQQKDLNKPTLQPWVFKKFTTTYKVFERNPYYWRVDATGNQLPYIDQIVCTVVDSEVYQMKVISGEADVAFMHTTLANYSLYKENEEQGGYRVVEIPGVMGSDLALGINQNKPDPKLRKIYQDVKFRQALSLAINREEINDSIYFGLAVPRQATVLPSCTYYKEEWEEAYAQYDLDEANRLLDEAGLTKRDRDGFRIGPDGEPLLLLIEYGIAGTGGGGGDVTAPLELVKEYWEAVGLMVLLKGEEPSFFSERRGSPDHSVIAISLLCSEEISNYVNEAGDWNVCQAGDLGWAPTWGQWQRAKIEVETGKKTLEDFEGGNLPGEEPPEEIKKLQEWVRQRNQAKLGSRDYTELSQKIFDFHAKKVFMIGTVGMSPTLYIAKKNIGNVPKAYRPGQGAPLTLNWQGVQLFFKQQS